jgi:DNA-binding GntR family transcriptional regulator
MKMEDASYDFLEVPPAPARGNVTVAVTEALRRAIVTLDLRPGAVIDKSAVCTRLGVSRFPVSEALARLQAEGLVEIQPQRGSIVSLVRVADVLEHMLIRRALESEALRVVADRGQSGLVQALRTSLALQRQAADQDRPEDFHLQDLAFHELLFDALRLPKVKAVIDSARSNLDRARRLINTPRRLALTIAEHEAIVAALALGDAEGAANAMRAHLDAVMVEVVAFARQQPQLFADGAAAGGDSFAALYPHG